MLWAGIAHRGRRAPSTSRRKAPRGCKRELDELWRVKRPAVTRAVSEAAAQGDRSENAEYIYGKKQLAEIDRRVRHLRKRLTGIRVVDQAPSDTSKVFFGAWFELADDDGRRTNTGSSGPTSSTSRPTTSASTRRSAAPCSAKALGAEVDVPTPEGERRYELTAVRYGQESEAKKSPAEAGRVTGGNR